MYIVNIDLVFVACIKNRISSLIDRLSFCSMQNIDLQFHIIQKFHLFFLLICKHQTTVHIFINISMFYRSTIYLQAAIAAASERISKWRKQSSRHNHVLIDIYYKAKYNWEHFSYASAVYNIGSCMPSMLISSWGLATMFSAVARILCSIKHDYNYDYTSARTSSSLANPPTGCCYSCLKINHTPVKYRDINKNVDSSLMFINKKNCTILSQYFACYKNQVNPSMNWFGFMRIIKPSWFLQRTKINSIFAKELQKLNQFLWLLQKPNWFL